MIRKATEADLELVTALYSKIHDAEATGAVCTGWLRDVYPTAETARAAIAREDLYILEEEDLILGCGIINTLQVDGYAGAPWQFEAPGDQVCVLHTLVIDPEAQGKGYGRAFLEFYENLAAERGITELRLDTNEINAAAREMYRKHGYQEVDIIPTVFNGIPGVHLVLLEKNLNHPLSAFRPMRRFRQQITRAECLKALTEAPRGVLSLMGENGYPYGIPMNHWYNPANGKLYFHGAKAGHKIDALTACDKVSYCVRDEGYREEGDWALHFRSVVVFGRIRLVTDERQAEVICSHITRKFTPDEEYLRSELRSLPRVQCLELTPEHMTGKKVKES